MPIDLTQYYPDWIKEYKRCEQYLEAALEYAHGAYDIETIFEGLMDGSLELWPSENAGAVTQIVEYPRKKILHIFLAGGDIEELKVLYTHVELYARQIGCQAITLTGRPGWAKSFLTEIDFKVKEVQMYKEL